MSKPKQKHTALYYIAAVVWMTALILLDQKLKVQMTAALKGTAGRTLIPGVLGLSYVENRGMAFGLLQGGSWFFIVFTVIVLAALALAYHAIPQKKRFLPLSAGVVLIAAGAVGNFIDRLKLGYVVDYLKLEFMDFPVFNLADCFITWTGVLLTILIIFMYREEDFKQIHL